MRNRITIDAPRHEVRVNGKEVYLRPSEFEILNILVAQNGKYLSRLDIIYKLGKTDEDIDAHTVTQHICRMRKKLPRGAIRTVPEYGYRFIG